MSKIQITLRMGALVAAAALLPSGSAFAQDEPPTTLRLHSVGDLAPPPSSVLDGARDPDFTSLETDWQSAYSEADYLVNWEERPDEGSVAASVADFLDDVLSETDGEFSIDSTPAGVVALRATDDGHRRAEAALALLRRQLAGSVHVDVRALTLDRAALRDDVVGLLRRVESGTLDEAGIERLVALDRHGGQRGGDLLMDPGWWSVLRQIRAVRAVVDVDVEIAQSSSISDPIGRSLSSGLRVACLPLPLQDGRVLLRVVAATGDHAEPLRRANLGQTANGTIELPEFRGALLASEIVLAQARTAGIVLWQPGGDARVLLLRLVSAPRPATGGTLALLSTAGLTRALPDVRVSWGDDPDVQELRRGVDFQVHDAQSVRLSDDTVQDVLYRTIASDLDDGTAYLTDTSWLGGGTLLVRAAEDRVARVRRALAELERTAITPARVSVRIEERDAAGASRPLGTLAGLATAGATLAMGAYRTLAYVADQDVEVAEAARISDPRVERAMVGALANVRVRPVGKEFSVDLGLRVSMLVSGPEQIPHGADNVGLVERVVTDVRVINTRVRLAPGATSEIVLGESTLGAPGQTVTGQLVAVVRVDPM